MEKMNNPDAIQGLRTCRTVFLNLAVLQNHIGAFEKKDFY